MSTDRISFGEASENTQMFGGIFVLLASWGLGGNLLLCALIYQGNLWTMMNRGLMAISVLGIFQSLFCLLPIGISGINKAWDFGDAWCNAYPFLYRFSQISVIYLIALLLVYNIMSLRTDNNPTEMLVKSSLWAPVLIFVLPYFLLLPPALVFLKKFGVTDIQEDKSNLHACTIVVVDQSNDNFVGYRGFRALEALFGLLLPYVAVIALFGYLVALINRRKVSKNQTALADSYSYNEGGELHMKTATEVLSDTNSEPGVLRASFQLIFLPQVDVTIYNGVKDVREDAMSPVHTMESLANRSDKHSEVVIYVLTGTFILFFTPYLYQTVSELVDPDKIVSEDDGLFRFLSHILSYMVVLINPTIYTLQYPTIKEALMKRELLKLK